jgi:pyrroloquinoline-quinone synthase
MTVSHERLLQEVSGIVHERDQIHHPIHGLLFDGKFSRAQIREFVGQTSCIPLYNHRYHGRLYVKCPDHRWRVRIAEVVYEEGTGRLFAGGVAHHELYLRFGEAVGISRQELYDWPLCAEAIGFMTFFENICGRSFLEGASAHMLAAEAMVPGYAGKVADALQRHYGLTAEQAVFWTVHEDADKDHSDIGRELLQEFVRTEEDARLVRRAVRECVEMMWLMHDGIYRTVLAAGQ